MNLGQLKYTVAKIFYTVRTAHPEFIPILHRLLAIEDIGEFRVAIEYLISHLRTVVRDNERSSRL